MTPRNKRSKRPAKTAYSPMDAFDIAYFKRTAKNDPAQTVPGRIFLASVPLKVSTLMKAVLVDVAQAPPHRYSGGGYWEAMHDQMRGIYEIRVNGPKRTHYRLFCVLDREALNQPQPLLTIITGLSKPFRTTFTSSQHDQVDRLRREYFSDNPRSLD